MEPFLDCTKDEALISAIKEKPKEGDVILFKKGNTYVLHRIIKAGLFGYVTKGDNRPAPDGLVLKSQVLGKLEGIYTDGVYRPIYQTSFALRVAGIDIKIKASERQKAYCKEYLIKKAGDDAVFADGQVPCSLEKSYDINVSTYTIEAYRIMAQLWEKLYKFDALMLHSAAVEMGGKAYVFLGPSGIGKSTHVKFLKQCYGDKVKVINGDKPILRMIDGKPFVCGTPWCGKESWNSNVMVELGGVVIFDRPKAEDGVEASSKIEKVDGIEAFDFLLSQVFMPKDVAAKEHTLSLFDDIFSKAPIYHLWATKSQSAAQLSYMTLAGVPSGDIDITEGL